MISEKAEIQSIAFSPDHHCDVLRLDLLHPELGGNKWFKLKFNLDRARTENKNTLLTFGGAFSNHIAATAAAGRVCGFQTIGIIRGEESLMNPTLGKAREDGMRLHFVSRSDYSRKDDHGFIVELHQRFGDFYLIPEGGNNAEGVRGCATIPDAAWDYDHVLCACGTATTYTGLLLSVSDRTVVTGISVLKGRNDLPDAVNHLIAEWKLERIFSVKGNETTGGEKITEHSITNAYAFNGYAGMDPDLISFKRNFETHFDIPLDHIYTVKLFYAVQDLLKLEKISKGSRLLIVHSGGLQGNEGFEKRYDLR